MSRVALWATELVPILELAAHADAEAVGAEVIAVSAVPAVLLLLVLLVLLICRSAVLALREVLLEDCGALKAAPGAERWHADGELRTGRHREELQRLLEGGTVLLSAEAASSSFSILNPVGEEVAPAEGRVRQLGKGGLHDERHLERVGGGAQTLVLGLGG
jgi:hypothetical protein